jgi:hypothetical protein
MFRQMEQYFIHFNNAHYFSDSKSIIESGEITSSSFKFKEGNKLQKLLKLCPLKDKRLSVSHGLEGKDKKTHFHAQETIKFL